MNFCDIDWADSDLENIHIEYDRATLAIWNDALAMRLTVECSGLAGITNLCIWDDTIIVSAKVYPTDETRDAYLRSLYEAYDKNSNYGGRSLCNGFVELRVKLVNCISFSVYCQEVSVTEHKL